MRIHGPQVRNNGKDQVGAKMDSSSIASLGKIEVNVRRVINMPPGPAIYLKSEQLHHISEVSEKMLKGKAITNTVECADPLPCSAPAYRHDYRHMSAPQGEPLVYTILYRSRRTLQMLGCIARTPSPESEDIDEGRAAVGNAAREREIQDLRARLALLERNGRVKAEPSSGAAGIKHERGDVEVVSARKRSRRSGPAEFVDLTSD
ncbi:MAG: hypothetical protein Q9191_002816 [Dirinaria sp. TL-2023a]